MSEAQNDVDEMNSARRNNCDYCGHDAGGMENAAGKKCCWFCRDRRPDMQQKVIYIAPADLQPR